MSDVPMPRLPNNRRFYNRRREDLVASAVAAVLRTEGRVVEDGCRPPVGEGRSPDWMMTVDGEPTALEVTRLLPPPYVQKAQHVVTYIETEVRSLLTPDISGLGGQVNVVIDYSASAVAKRLYVEQAADASRLALDVRAVLHTVEPGADRPIEMPSSIPWVIRAEISLLPGPQDGFYIVQRPDEAQPDLDEFVAWAITKKGDQHVGHAERAILAVDAMFDEAEDLREALARSPVLLPWWRVYQVLRSDATVVHERDADGAT
jgi:hypothetical protein